MFLNDFDSLFEKFSILTIDGHLTDRQAFQFLKDKTTPELFKSLVDKVMELTIG